MPSNSTTAAFVLWLIREGIIKTLDDGYRLRDTLLKEGHYMYSQHRYYNLAFAELERAGLIERDPTTATYRH